MTDKEAAILNLTKAAVAATALLSALELVRPRLPDDLADELFGDAYLAEYLINDALRRLVLLEVVK